LSIDGDLKWYRGLASDNPKLGNDIGMASSPMIANGVVVCQAESQGESFVEALKVADGTTLWKNDRPKDSNWTSPIYLPANDDDTADMVLVKCDASVSAHELQTGHEVWRIDGEIGGIPCMVATKKHIYVPGAKFMALDRSSDSASVAWDSNKINPSPSPVITDKRLVFINSA
jgi:outer membrane protein assembly factor BamB